jgi:hypothetical protein
MNRFMTPASQNALPKSTRRRYVFTQARPEAEAATAPTIRQKPDTIHNIDRSSRTVKPWTLLAVAVGTFLVGVWAGVVAEQGVAERKLHANQLSDYALLQDRLKSAAVRNDLVEYEAALWAHLIALEQLRKTGNPLTTVDGAYFMDRSMSYARLAAIAATQGQTTKEQSQMGRAIEECVKSGRDWCFASDLRTFVSKVDSKWLAK